MFQLPDLTFPQLPDLSLPKLPDGWSYFVSLQDGFFVAITLLLITLLIIWWRQQSILWFRIVTSALLAALLLSIASFYLFVIMPYEVGCFDMCTGWRGFPRPIAFISLDGRSWVGPVDFGANVTLLWLFLLTVVMLWRILMIAVGWEGRSIRTRLMLPFFFFVLPWALLPRFFSPPQPAVYGEDQRVANNALRAAEFTYSITGPWVQRLALEDIREREANTSLSAKQVCLRGYTYFYIPWQRYRLVLEVSGVSSVDMVEMPLSGSCWPE